MNKTTRFHHGAPSHIRAPRLLLAAGIGVLVLALVSFGSEAERLGDMARRLPPLDAGIITRQVREYDAEIRLCAAGHACNLPTAFLDQMKRLHGLPRWEQLQQVDAWVNNLPYRTVNGPGDSVAKFLNQGGSCKEYALTKLVMLRDLGFDLQHLMLATVKMTEGPYHQVLLVKIDGALMVLSNYATNDPGPRMLAFSIFNDLETLRIVRVSDGAVRGASGATQYE